MNDKMLVKNFFIDNYSKLQLDDNSFTDKKQY